jgi:predicted acetylornithine/succinylornithine family transaminase
MDLAELRRLDETYVVQNYGTRLPLAFVRGEGVYLIDTAGRRYLDFLSGIAVCTLGHAHPRLTAALQEQVATLLHTTNYFHIGPQSQAARHLVELSGLDRVFFCNSGAEANEALLKAARRWGAARFGEGVKPTLITFGNSFHGRTLATLTATGNAKVREGFAPLMPGFKEAPFNDLAAAEAAIDDTVCGFLVEPIQGEGGINVADTDFLVGLRRLCDERGLLLLLDEVQCGMGRTGAWFAYQQYGIQPDAMALAKGLGGGVPIGAMVCRQELADALAPGSHGTTFGGNFLATRAALCVLEVMRETNLLEQVRDVADCLWSELQALCARQPLCTAPRGRGLMLGVGLAREVAAAVRDAAAGRGLIINAVRPDTLRLLPPLIISRAHVQEAIAKLEAALSDVSGR